MTLRQVVAYGAWPSPISAADTARAGVRVSFPRVDGELVHWLERRPLQGGRQVVVRCDAQKTTHDLLPENHSARTTVHEYGGVSYAVDGGVLYYVEHSDQQVWRLQDGAPVRLTSPGPRRHADITVDTRRQRLLCVVEEHGQDGVLTSLGAVPFAGGDATMVASGCDFYASPRLSADGGSIAWLQWNFPNMPWDGCELWRAELNADGGLEDARRVAGGPQESIFDPQWSADGVLHFVSDRSGWWNLYALEGADVRPLAPMDAECGTAQWQFGMSTYALLDGGDIAFVASSGGTSSIHVRESSGRVRMVPSELTDIAPMLAFMERRLLLVAATPRMQPSMVSVDVDTGSMDVVRAPSEVTLAAPDVSVPEAISYPGHGGETAHALFYPPRNSAVEAPDDQRPPLIVHAHGGPTSAVGSAFNLDLQYWTTRGFAVVDVNYAGSTGYGRAYRQRLNGQFGIADIGDCVAAARHLVQRGDVDADRLLVSGGSAGGWVVLCSMAFHDVFAAGTSHFGVSDLEMLARDTHKFESRYFDHLVGPYPEAIALYRQRSPLHHADGITTPVLFTQGLDDPIVLPDQAQSMFESLRRRGIPCAYVTFAGEQHGYRRAENIEQSLACELSFYSRVLGMPIADAPAVLEIANL